MAEQKDLGKSSTGMAPNLAAALSYLLGVITGIIFYVLEKENTAGKLKVINAERIPVRSSFNIAPSLYITSISGPIYNRFTTGNKY